MSEHTPGPMSGPWTLHAGRNPHYGDDKINGRDYEATLQRCYYIAGPDVRQGDSHFIADLIVERAEVGDANAALICAAPDLLAACKALLSHTRIDATISRWECPICGADSSEMFDVRHSADCAVVVARAAIAKAETA